MKGMSHYRRILEQAMGRKLKGPFWHVHHINGNHDYNAAKNLWELAEPIHREIDRGALEKIPRPSDPDSEEDGYLNKEALKVLCEIFKDGEKNKNQPFKSSASYFIRTKKGVFGRLLEKGILNQKEYTKLVIQLGRIYKAGQQMKEKKTQELIEA